MKMAVFTGVEPYSLVDTDQQFSLTYCLYHQGGDGGKSSSKRLVSFYQTTRCNIPDNSHLYNCTYIHIEGATSQIIPIFITAHTYTLGIQY
jgi:hypothetical protein